MRKIRFQRRKWNLHLRAPVMEMFYWYIRFRRRYQDVDFFKDFSNRSYSECKLCIVNLVRVEVPGVCVKNLSGWEEEMLSIPFHLSSPSDFSITPPGNTYAPPKKRAEFLLCTISIWYFKVRKYILLQNWIPPDSDCFWVLQQPLVFIRTFQDMTLKMSQRMKLTNHF